MKCLLFFVIEILFEFLHFTFMDCSFLQIFQTTLQLPVH